MAGSAAARTLLLWVMWGCACVHSCSLPVLAFSPSFRLARPLALATGIGSSHVSYLVFGLVLQALSWGALALLGAELQQRRQSGGSGSGGGGSDSSTNATDVAAAAASGWCGALPVAGLLFVATLGQVTVGVMCDTFVVENMTHERGGAVRSMLARRGRGAR